MKQKVSFNPQEFTSSFTSYSSGIHHAKVTKHSRKEKLTSCVISVVDKINGTRAEVIIPEGHYSKKEMQKLRNSAVEKLMIMLYTKR